MDALAWDGDEGRGVTAKSLGELLPSFDPGIPEWGNPVGVTPRYPRLNV